MPDSLMTPRPGPACHGWIANPHYRKQELRQFRGNPLIEVLPPIMSVAEAGMVLQRRPDYDPQDRLLADHYRWQLIDQIGQLFLPTPEIITLERNISSMIRTGYLARNPLDPRFGQRIDAAVAALTQPTSYLPPHSQDSNSMAIIGDPGVGKTTAVHAVLGTYPQVYEHGDYEDGRPFAGVQLTYLIVRCPADGSPRALLLAILAMMTAVLGNNYYDRYSGDGRASQGALIPVIGNLAGRHHLGMIVIDEFQAMRQATEEARGQLLNFLVRLNDELKLPLLIVGGASASAVLRKQIRLARRGEGQGASEWLRMPYGSQWESFAETLWTYQYLRTPTPLTEELSATLHQESLGIPDYAVKIFRFAQRRAIIGERSPDGGQITPAMLHAVAQQSLPLSRRRLAALRQTNDLGLLALRREEEDFIINLAEIHPEPPAAPAADHSATVAPSTVPTAAGTPRSQAAPGTDGAAPAREAPERQRRPKTRPEGIHTAAAAQAARGQEMHDNLDESRLLRPADEFLTPIVEGHD